VARPAPTQTPRGQAGGMMGTAPRGSRPRLLTWLALLLVLQLIAPAAAIYLPTAGNHPTNPCTRVAPHVLFSLRCALEFCFSSLRHSCGEAC
jgi:hypothetical protein